MQDYDPTISFGRPGVAARDLTMERGDERETVDFLAGLAHGGAALEFAIGTGRIAVPLGARGVDVDGIELSTAMSDELRTRPGSDDVSVTIGDMSTVDLAKTYRLVYVVFNSLFNLLTQRDQVMCFHNATRHLTDRGRFVVEAFVPSYLHRLTDEQDVRAGHVGAAEVRLDALRHDPVTQTLDGNHIRFSSEGVGFNPIVLRYAWPSELDLMAQIAGLELDQRWGGWQHEPFTATSQRHISVYRRFDPDPVRSDEGGGSSS